MVAMAVNARDSHPPDTMDFRPIILCTVVKLLPFINNPPFVAHRSIQDSKEPTKQGSSFYHGGGHCERRSNNNDDEPGEK